MLYAYAFNAYNLHMQNAYANLLYLFSIYILMLISKEMTYV